MGVLGSVLELGKGGSVEGRIRTAGLKLWDWY